ncbi:MAG: hypothetical protein ACRDKW_08330 [Actinomycetota bacterium]
MRTPPRVARWLIAAMLATAAVVSTIVPLPVAMLARLLKRQDEQEQVASPTL